MQNGLAGIGSHTGMALRRIILKETCHDGACTNGVAMGLADPYAEIVQKEPQ